MTVYEGKETLLDYVVMDIPDGDHYFVTNANDELIRIRVQFVNFYEDTIYTTGDVIGSTFADGQMLVLKYHKNLTIESDSLFTPQARKSGMLIHVEGTLVNRGTISMTARGARSSNPVGLNVYLMKNGDTYEMVPGTGGAGAAPHGAGSVAHGKPGENGTNRGTGGGGSGGTGGTNPASAGSGSAGTSFSGGTGGGGVYHANSRGTSGAGNGVGFGRDGGSGSVKGSGYRAFASGGVGNPPGKSAFNAISSTYVGTLDNLYAEEGTGGLLIVYAKDIINHGIIESRGCGTNINSSHNTMSRISAGGSSGGGSINLFYRNQYINDGEITAKGGTSTKSVTLDYCWFGGNGGDGSITVTKYSNATKYLVQDGEEIKTYNGTTWDVVGMAPVSIEMLSLFGMDSLDAFYEESLSLLNDDELLLHNLRYNETKSITLLEETKGAEWLTLGHAPATEEMFEEGILEIEDIRLRMDDLKGDQFKLLSLLSNHTEEPTLVLNAVPPDALLSMNYDIESENIYAIDYLRISGSPAPYVRVAVSFDSGNTWTTNKMGVWQPLDYNIDAFKTAAMSLSEFNALNRFDWDSGWQGSKPIRLAFLLTVTNSSQEARMEELVSQMDLQGRWKRAKHADWEYVTNEFLNVILTKSGDYKITY